MNESKSTPSSPLRGNLKVQLGLYTLKYTLRSYLNAGGTFNLERHNIFGKKLLTIEKPDLKFGFTDFRKEPQIYRQIFFNFRS